LVRRGLAASREQAQEAIAAGRVTVAGAPADKASRLVASADPLVVEGPARRFVSRGGEKLEAGLDTFAIDVRGKRVLDAGASTGGFTDCVLQRGAASVVAVDAGRGQLHDRLQRNPQVASLERTNVRYLNLAGVGGVPFTVVVADLSFISLRTVAPVLVGDVAARGADVVALVKPQFEAGRAEASKGRGVIRDPAVWLVAVQKVASAFEAAGAAIMGAMVSPLKGADGNVEFLLHAVAHDRRSSEVDLTAVVASVGTS
jgi:23S rRNA (cytidine1920-2'-O)/16S rRNA (cytidine1409-2'-O)-methyltransferase